MRRELLERKRERERERERESDSERGIERGDESAPASMCEATASQESPTPHTNCSPTVPILHR
jgi:hypothetical protein